MLQLVGQAMRFGPIFFGLGFLAPVIAASLGRLGWGAPLGLAPISFGLLLGGLLGAVAMVRNRWI